MNYETTKYLLDAIQLYLKNANIIIKTENKNYPYQKSISDYVIIDETNDVGFEVFDNEIIVYYFTDHCHFEDYTSKLHEKEDDYIKRAESFLKELFKYKIRHAKYYKGKTLYLEKYILMYYDGRNDEIIGSTWYGLFKLINPFAKKYAESKTWQFDIDEGIYTTRDPKVINPNAIEVVDINDDCYIEIFYDIDSYYYSITEIDFDDYHGRYFWTPFANLIPSGRYDTKEKAIYYAKEALKCRDNL